MKYPLPAAALLLSLAALAQSAPDTAKPSYPLLDRTFAAGLTPAQRRALGGHPTLERTVAALTPEQKAAVRKRLDAARADAATPDAMKELAHGYLLLDEQGPRSGEDVIAIGARLRELEPKKPGGYSIAAEGYYRRGDYPAAAAQARQALALSRGADQTALSILKMSEGRSSAATATPVAAASAVAPDGATDARAGFTIPEKNDISPQAMVFVRQAAAARQKGDMETTWAGVQAAMNADPASMQVQKLYAFAKSDREKYTDTMEYLRRSKEASATGHGDEAVSWAQKAADRSGDPSVRGILELRLKQNAHRSQAPGQPEAPKNGAPLWPIAAGLGLTAAAYGVYRSKQTWSSDDGPGPAPGLTPEQSRSKNLKTAVLAGTALIGIAAWEFGPGALAAARTLFAAAGPAAPTAQLATASAGTDGATLVAGRTLAVEGVNAAGATAILIRAGTGVYDHVSYSQSSQNTESSGANETDARRPQSGNGGIKKPSATNPELQKVIDKLFQPGDTKPGGTAGAVRDEFTSGQPTQGRFHLQAAHERISWLNRIMREQNLSPIDRATAEAMRDDLQQAVDLYKTKPAP